MTRSNKQGFTLVELLVVIAILGILIGLMLPAIQAVREAARKAQCTSQIRQLVLAAHTYHDKQKKFPPSCHKIGEVSSSSATTASTLKPDGYSWLADLLPSMEEQALYDQFKSVVKGSPNDAEGANTVKGVEQNSVKEGLSRRIPLFLCPSTTKSEGVVEYEDGHKEGITNYVAMGATTAKSLKLSVEEGSGSEWDKNATKPDGATYPGSKTTTESMKDGTANTIYACESADEYRRWAVGSDASVVALPTSDSIEGGSGDKVISPKEKGQAAGDGVTVKFGFLSGWTPGKRDEESTVEDPYCYLEWDYDYDAGDGSYKDVIAEAATQQITGKCSEADTGVTRKGVSSYHSGVIVHAMADASVTAISTSADPQIYMFMTTANAGDPSDKP